MSEAGERQWLAAAAGPRLELARRAWAAALAGPLDAEVARRCRVAILELLTFVYEPGHAANNYSRLGVPQTHNGWEMQLLVDAGLLFFVYSRCRALVEAARDEATLGAGVEALLAELDRGEPQALRRALAEHYAATIEAFLIRERQPVDPLVESLLERAVIELYLGLAMTSPAAIVTLDLFPAHTGPENVVEGLRGLVTVGLTPARQRAARRFFCCRAESYTRYYGLNVAKQLARVEPGPLADAGGPLRFSLVVPHANGVRQITLTRCWPIDGAENAARYVQRLRRLWATHERALGPRSHAAAPRILVSGYSQGGAAVRMLDDAIHGADVLARAYFRQAAPRGYGSRCRTLARVIGGEWRERPGPKLYTLSVATMGGIDGWALSERFPEHEALAEDHRGASGVRARANACGGLHLAICHDYDPARWILPTPLFNLDRRLRRRERKLSIVRVLLKFGGPNLTFHGGTWAADTAAAFADNASARALLDDVHAEMLSPRFVDEHRYFDDRCERAAFPHLVVGTHGYPGWMVVEYFAEALARLQDQARDGAGERAELLHEGSWGYDILPGELAYDEVVAAAARFHERQRQRGLALLAQLERGPAVELGDELVEILRRRFASPGARRHVVARSSRGPRRREP